MYSHNKCTDLTTEPEGTNHLWNEYNSILIYTVGIRRIKPLSTTTEEGGSSLYLLCCICKARNKDNSGGVKGGWVQYLLHDILYGVDSLWSVYSGVLQPLSYVHSFVASLAS